MKSFGRKRLPFLFKNWRHDLVLFGVAALLCVPAAARGRRNAVSSAPVSDRRISAERVGTVPAGSAHRLILTADSGSVQVFTDASSEVRYRVRVEAQAADPDANRLLKEFSLVARGTSRGVELNGRMPNPGDFDRVWVTYEVHVPRRYDLEISTRAGDIETQDIDGHEVLSTGGGNIRAGRVGRVDAGHSSVVPHDSFVARLETGGGHIFVGDVAGGLRASTTGGHIVAANVHGDAVLHTGGGHIQVGRVSGTAQLSTGGGNIVAEGAEGGVEADSAGGRIELGEAGGAIRARTGGGGIRIAHVAGPTDLDSSGGGIFLAGVAAPLRAATTTGTITAWFSPMFGDGGGSMPGGPPSAALPPSARHGSSGLRVTPSGSELASRQGDIIVYLPREMAVTIDAVVEQGSGHGIVADPSLPLKVSYEDSAEGRVERGECALNGGGEVLHLRTSAGDIQLRLLDPETARRLAEQQSEAVARRQETQEGILADLQGPGPAAGDGEETAVRSPAAGPADGAAAEATSGFFAWTRWFDEFWWGGLRVDPEDEQQRLVRSVAPVYPDVARQAGIEGDVTLRIVVGPDGSVIDAHPLAGDPVLGRAAVDAVGRWHYVPTLIDGHPVSVVTTVTLAFRLH